MLKYLWICAAFVTLGAGPLHAQEQEAILQTVKVPGAGFDFVLAMPHPEGGALANLGNTPDALIVHLQGAQLAVVFEDAGKMVQALDSLKNQIGTFQAAVAGNGSLQPVALYVVPMGRTIAIGEQMTNTRSGAKPRWPSLVPNDTAGLP